MSGAPERELKFEFDPGEPVEVAVDAVLRSSSSVLIAPRVQRVESTYFDTPALDLRARGMVLRVRRAGDRYIQTIKRATCPGASFERWEFEHEIAGPAPRLSAADRTAFEGIALRRGKRAFRPVFTVTSERTTWTGAAEGVNVEFALDRGEIAAGRATSALHELEIELKQGTTKNLFGLARRLAALGRLRPTNLTKDERGYRLLEESWDHAARQGPAPVTAKMGPREAFHAIALVCLQHFMLNERVVRGACDPDAVHQARIAIRRLRSALTLFKPVVADGRYEEVKAELKGLSDALGAVRDLSVFEQRTLRPAMADQPLRGLDGLAMKAASAKQAKYDALLAMLNAPERQQTLVGLIEWVEAGDWRAGEAAEKETAVRFAHGRLRKAWKRLVRDSAKLHAAPDGAIHDLRKRAKRLRYAEEFFGRALKGKKQRQAHNTSLRALERVQRNLGRRQDMITARETLAAIVDDSTVSADVAFAAGHLDGRLVARLAGSKAPKLKKAAAEIAAAKPF
jgi:inorganic triphosphatase YgiF